MKDSKEILLYSLEEKKVGCCDHISLFIINTEQRHSHLPPSVARLKWGFIYRPLLAYKRLMFVLVECCTEVYNGSFAAHTEVYSGDCHCHMHLHWSGSAPLINLGQLLVTPWDQTSLVGHRHNAQTKMFFFLLSFFLSLFFFMIFVFFFVKVDV